MSHLQKLLSEFKDLQLPVQYWDVRVEDTVETTLTLQNGEIVTCSASPSSGAFIRVLKNNFWYYESTTNLAGLKEVLTRLSQQNVGGSEKDKFGKQKANSYVALHFTKDRFSAVSLEEKLNLAKHYDEILKNGKWVVNRVIRYKDMYKVKSYLNSEGTQFEYDFNQGGLAYGFTLKDEGALFDDHAKIFAVRFEDLKNQDQKVKHLLEEGLRFVHAPAVAPGKYRVVLHPGVTGIFTHESFGHKSEADFLLGNDEAIAEWEIGKKIASDCLSIMDHGMEFGTSGYCPIDDDGTLAKQNYLIKDGVLAGRLHSRETAHILGESTTGNSRAMSFEFEPIVRMTSTYIKPGTENIESIMKRLEGALLIEGSKHGSGLSTFTIAASRGYRILKDGVREPVRLTLISGLVTETLKNIEAVSSDFQLDSSAIGGCGKMDQFPLPVSFGGPYIVVSEMQVS